MATTSVRIDSTTRDTLRQLARESGVPMREVLERAVESYRRQRFVEEANAAYAALQADSQAWREELKEREAWDATLADGLDDE
jgi:predicted transcriptional regulator